MADIELTNKPLVEAIFEIRWELEKVDRGLLVDPHYQILIGRIYDRVIEKCPYHEKLPAAAMPDEIAAYIVKHRFRKEKDGWPLIQLGPGIISFNETAGYKWTSFSSEIHEVLAILFDAYPNAEKNLKINSLLLRYIDAVEFDYDNEDLFAFLKNSMKFSIGPDASLFEEAGIPNSLSGLDARISFQPSKPKGALHLRFIKGKKDGVPAVIWETQVQSIKEDSPKSNEDIRAWLEDAHEIVHKWFFKTIEGDLFERFK